MTMKNYRFLIESPAGLNLTFLITAHSREEAVKIANEAFAEEHESDSIFLRSNIHHAHLYVGPDFCVDESMIVEESDASIETLKRAMNYLGEQGYEYDGPEEDLWVEENPRFRKLLQTSDGGIYGFLVVEAYYEYNISNYSFKTTAFLYPIVNARIADGEGGLHYSVQFRDKQLFTTLDELPLILAFYESKYLELIKVLRQADPVDGLPLEEKE
jgi:hypothetical protein